MGGIPSLLLTIAAVGVTYGWQPDKNGDDAGAVEYIVQVSPGELSHLRQSGEISSVIDPRVRGHVSRVVIRVGTGDVPRKTPTAITTNRVAALKPDPQSGGGFGLPPSLQNTVNDAVGGMGQQAFDKAGRALQTSGHQVKQKANNLLDRMRGNGARPQQAATSALVPPPSTRPTPSLMGGATSGGYARPRTGGPSTAPAQRDNHWNRNATTATPPLGNRQLGTQHPSNQPLTTVPSPFANRQPTTASPAGLNRDGSLNSGRAPAIASNGLRSSDTFGKYPAGLQPRANPVTTDRSQDGIYSQIDQTRRDFQNKPGDRRLTNPLSTARSGSTAGAFSQDTFQLNPASGSQPNPARPNPALTQEQIAAGAWDFDAHHRLIDRHGHLLRVPEPTLPRERITPTYQAPATSTAQSTDRYRRDDPLASFVDRTVDRTVDRAPSRYADRDRNAQASIGTGATMGFPRTNADLYRDSGYQEPRNQSSRPPLRQQNEGHFANDDARYASRDLAADSRYREPPPRDYNRAPAVSRYPSQAGTLPAAPPALASPSDRIITAGTVAPTIRNRPKTAAAQPFFIWLLLISFVANVYLLYWLKNLRVQFKDMVTAKRIATSAAV